METVSGSGERLTIAIIVRSKGGQATVRQAIDPPTIAAIFGKEGKGMQFIVGTTVLKIHEQLSKLVPVSKLEFPFGDIHRGTGRECTARDANEVFGIALRMSSGFAQSSFGMSQQEMSPAKEVQLAFEEWTDKIRTEVLIAQEREQWSSFFNVSIPLLGRKKARFGFVNGGYVAQFGVLRPGTNAASDLRALKIKLFDLEVVRRELALQFSTAELVVGFNDPHDAVPSRQRETLLAAWEHLEYEAKERKIRAIRYKSAHEAAGHVMQMVA